MSETKTRKAKWPPTRIAKWGGLLAALAVLASQLYEGEHWLDVSINTAVSFVIWYVVFFILAWLVTTVIGLFRKESPPGD